MNRQVPVVDIAGNFEESVIQWSKHLGTDKVRRAIFVNIYGRSRRPRSKKQIMEAVGLKQSSAQSAQNALDHLSKHNLIVKMPNDGSVKDGSKLLYAKDATVGAHKDKIIRFADNKALAARTPTKRAPASVRRVQSKPAAVSALKKKKKLVVLFLTSSPDPNYPLRVDAEIRKVQEAIRGSIYRDNVQIAYKPAADISSILEGLNDLRPQIVHFSGHGDHDGVVADTGGAFQNSVDASNSTLISYDLLAKALAATDSPPVVLLLNSCWGSKGEKALKPVVKFLISMNRPISDLAAMAFAPKFYAAIASGQSVKAAFEQAKIAVEVASISDAATPELYANEDPSRATLT